MDTAVRKRRAKTRTDPVTAELVRTSLIAATEEMKSVLMRTSYNMIIYEALDFTVGLFDRDGRTLSIGLGLPMFIRGMSDTVIAKVKHFGYEGIEPGDVLLTNDSYITGSHLNHLTFSIPVFAKNRIVGFSTCMAHWIDVGGILNGMTFDIYSEGLQIPIVKYARRGVVNQDVHDFIRMNVRRPERAMGDLEAQLSACRVGVRHFEEMLARHGTATTLRAFDDIMDQTQAEARLAVASIPDGTYEAESQMDDDGVDLERPIPIKVKVVVCGERMTVDLSGVSTQVAGFYNSNAGVACAQVAFKCIALPHDYPMNDGGCRQLEVIVPPGTVVSAVHPAPYRVWMTYPMTVVDTIFKALAPAIPERVAAGHHADLNVANVNGIHPRDGRLWIYLAGLIGGGWGAKSDEDGMSATIALNDGDTHNGPSEQVENKYPLIVRRYALREDSGGAGTFRGGLGTELVVECTAPINYMARVERVKNPPWGLAGGHAAFGNQIEIRRKDGSATVFPNGKVNTRLAAGETYIMRSGGGGGFGDPRERDRAAVRRDVRQGYVSIEKARGEYGLKDD